MNAPHEARHQAAASGEGALLERLRAGEDRAYEELVRTHAGRLMGVARRFLPAEEDARDAVQEAFVSAFRSLPAFTGGSRLSTWLHRITVNACLMRLRSRRRRPEQPIEDLLPRFKDNGHHLEPPQPWPLAADQLLEQEQTRVRVRTAIDQLPENYRTVLLLRDIEQLDTEEAAQVLGISPNAVKVRLHRAHQALRTLLDREFRGRGR